MTRVPRGKELQGVEGGEGPQSLPGKGAQSPRRPPAGSSRGTTPSVVFSFVGLLKPAKDQRTRVKPRKDT